MKPIIQSNYLKYILNLCIGVVITVCIFFYINYEELEVRKQAHDQESLVIKNRIQNELRKVNLVLESLKFTMLNTPNVDKDLFTSYTNGFIKELSGIEALEWAPKVYHDELLKYELEGKKRHSDTFYVKTHDENNRMIKSPKREYYHPIEFINPLHTNERMIGFDISSKDKRYHSLIKSYQNKKTSFTVPFRLVLGARDAYGFLALKYVEKSKYNPAGLLAGVYSMDSFMPSVTHNFNYEIDIYDIESGNLNFYSSHNKYNSYQETKIVKEYKIAAADREWRLVFSDHEGYLTFPHLYESYVVLVIGFLSTFIILIMIVNADKRRAVYTSEINKQNEELLDLNSQKDTLLKEVHHRVKNNMQSINSLLSMQSRYLENKEVKEVFEHSKSRILSMAIVHEMLYKSNDLRKVKTDKYLEELVSKIIISFKGYENKVNSSFNIDQLHFNADTSIPLGLIVTEIVTNSLKYAIKEMGELSVELFKISSSNYNLIISDNGPGFDFKAKEAKNTLGLKLIKRLIKQLHGTLNVESNTNGTSYRISFKDI